MCGIGWQKSDFNGWWDNLWPWESWNDRVSSYQTFNFLGRYVKFWDDPGYSGRYLQTYGDTSSENVSNLVDWNRNDTFSSAKIW